MTRPILYEVNTRCWLGELSDRAGRRLTLADVPESEFSTWTRRGFTHIWLMGVWTLGARGRAWSKRCYAGREHEFGCSDIAGSPYAINEYRVSRRLGGDGALAVFRARLHQHGLKLILDFVPNHTALDHPWVKSHPDYFVTCQERRIGAVKPFRGASKWYAHGDCGHGAPWVDTLQLEYRNTALRQAMLDELLAIAERCDGVRCDMAMLALNDVFRNTWRNWPHPFAEPSSEFWSDAISAVRERASRFLFLAEVYWDLEEKLQALGFDYTYDKRLYDKIIARDATGAAEHVRSQTAEYVARSAFFLENHDEPRVASLLGLAEHKAAAFLISVLPGVPFYHDGQFSGFRVHAHVHFSRRATEPWDDDLPEFYEILFSTLNASHVGRGEALIISPAPVWEGNPSHANFVLVQWRRSSGEWDLAAINLAPHASQCFAPVAIAEAGQGNWVVRDRFSGETHLRDHGELVARGLYLDLPGHGFRLFHCIQGT